MTKLEAIDTILVSSDKPIPSNEQLNEAREVITQAISDGYVLVNKKLLMSLLEASVTKEMAALIYKEVTE